MNHRTLIVLKHKEKVVILAQAQHKSKEEYVADSLINKLSSSGQISKFLLFDDSTLRSNSSHEMSESKMFNNK